MSEENYHITTQHIFYDKNDGSEKYDHPKGIEWSVIPEKNNFGIIKGNVTFDNQKEYSLDLIRDIVKTTAEGIKIKDIERDFAIKDTSIVLTFNDEDYSKKKETITTFITSEYNKKTSPGEWLCFNESITNNNVNSRVKQYLQTAIQNDTYESGLTEHQKIALLIALQDLDTHKIFQHLQDCYSGTKLIYDTINKALKEELLKDDI